jgi:serpin B
MQTIVRKIPLLLGLIALAVAGLEWGANKICAAPTKPTDGQLANAQLEFGLSLFRAVSHGPEENLCIAPGSVFTLLAMTGSGAAGETEREFQRVLKIDQPVRSLAPALADFNAKAVDAGQTAGTFRAANALWLRSGLDLRDDFRRLIQGSFQAQIESVDFTDSRAVTKKMDDWIAQATARRITHLLSSAPSSDTALILANAIYFKSRWSLPFEAVETRPQAFRVSSRHAVSARLMRRTADFKMISVPAADLLELPYVGEKLSLVIVLPKSSDGLPAFEEKLDAAQLFAWMAQLDFANPEPTAVAVPKFTFRTDMELTPALTQLGLKNAFDNANADFSGITAALRVPISEIMHRVFIEINEEGTEAAAETSALLTLGVISSAAKPRAFVADHPFLFAVREKSTGTVLLLGHVIEP